MPMPDYDPTDTETPLDRNAILGALDRDTDFVPIPKWGGKVLVKAMPMANTRYTLYITGGHKQKGPTPPREEFIRRMVGAVILSALDPDTEEQMFSWSDADKLRDKHWNSVLMVANKAFELAGDDEEDEEDEEGVPEPGPDETDEEPYREGPEEAADGPLDE